MATSSWCVVVLRAWRDQDGLKVRLLSSSEAGPASAVETSIQSACERVASYLAAVAGEPGDHFEQRHDDDGPMTKRDTASPYGPCTAPDG